MSPKRRDAAQASPMEGAASDGRAPRSKSAHIVKQNSEPADAEPASSHAAQSCLLHRLCLCNCICSDSARLSRSSRASASSGDIAKLQARPDASRAAGLAREAAAVAAKQVAGSRESGLGSGPLVVSSPQSAGSTEEMRSTMAHGRRKTSAEKQSPSFMKLLKSSSPFRRDVRHRASESDASNARRRAQAARTQAGHRGGGGGGPNLGSLGDLKQRSASAASSRTNESSTGATNSTRPADELFALLASSSSPSPRPRSRSASSDDDDGDNDDQAALTCTYDSLDELNSTATTATQPSTAADSYEEEEEEGCSLDEDFYDSARPHSSCSQPADGARQRAEQARRRARNYARFFSPARLFSPSSSSSTSIGEQKRSPLPRDVQRTESALSSSSTQAEEPVTQPKKAAAAAAKQKRRQHTSFFSNPLSRFARRSRTSSEEPEPGGQSKGARRPPPNRPQQASSGALSANESIDSLAEVFGRQSSASSTTVHEASQQQQQHTSAQRTRLISAPAIVLSRPENVGSPADGVGALSSGPAAAAASERGKVIREIHNTGAASKPQQSRANVHRLQPTAATAAATTTTAASIIMGRQNLSSLAGQLRSATDLSDLEPAFSDNGSESAYSLPTSPSPARRSPRLRQSPVPFNSPAAESSKIEDGLKVCSTEHFEKHIGNIKGNQLEAQKKLFKAWINYFCPNLIRDDLVEELRDGVKLIGMLAWLTRDKQLRSEYDKLLKDSQTYIFKIVNTPYSRLRHLSNVSIAIDYLRKHRGMKLVNLNPMDVVGGKPNVVLGLCWNIILNFQLEQNLLQSIEECDKLASSKDLSTSREDTAQQVRRNNQTTDTKINQKLGLSDEYSASDLVSARKRLLEYVNKRFNLRLTNLTSSLVDGDVLLAIISKLAPKLGANELFHNGQQSWATMNDEEKLDHCFELAQRHLHKPRLFSASDLMQRSIADNNSKPLLVYLSMLISDDGKMARVASNEDAQQLLAGSTDQLASKCPSYESQSVEARIRSIHDQVANDKSRFDVDRLQETLCKIKQLNDLIKIQKTQSTQTLVDDSDQPIGEALRADCERLSDEAELVERLITWINAADNLFETPQKASAEELARTIEEYQTFFSPPFAPEIKDSSMCPILERQYRECLSTAKQRVHMMEQTLKNQTLAEATRKEVVKWLAEAESQLNSCFNPMQSGTSVDVDPASSNVLSHHSERLRTLIDFFELEEVDLERMEMNLSQDPQGLRLAKTDTTNGSLASLDGSISGSLLSLGSNSSKLSTLQSSKKASYHALFDEFELRCRLYAAMLESKQKLAILISVKELRSRLRYITEFRVPQAVNELRMSISRCEMSIKESDLDAMYSEESEPASEANGEFSRADLADIPSEDELEETTDTLESPSISPARTQSPPPSQSELESPTSSPTVEESAQDKIIDEPKSARQRRKRQEVERVLTKNSRSKSNKIPVKRPESAPTKHSAGSNHKSSPTSGWSLFSWIKVKKTSREAKPVAAESQKRATQKKPKSAKEDGHLDMIWSKLVRAFRASMSLNIVLLICLAGICLLPLMHKDACCELSLKAVPNDHYDLHDKPT